MCGIAGFVFGPQENVDLSQALREMTRSLAHRGPDDEGFYETEVGKGRPRVGLGHRRLSIIDLASGHQPLGNEDDQIQIIFNGEIYNFQELRKDLVEKGHRFKTVSDTETIVHAYEEYGEECVNRLRGMFAFAIWDERRRALFLARDPFGKKPLFYMEHDGGFLFASEIKAILAFPGVRREADMNGVWEYLAYRYVPGPITLFRGINKIPPGCHAIWKDRRLSIHKYYTPPDWFLPMSRGAIRDPVKQFHDVLDEAVRIRMVSDVPFGAFLSGGIDSSSIVALMTRHSEHPISTFSIGFQEEEYSELRYANQVAKKLRTNHNELVVSARDFMGYLPRLTSARDAPVSEPADIPIFLLSVEARKTVKMVLTGEGSDEVLGGYPKHVVERFAQIYQRIPQMLTRKVLEPLVAHLPYGFRRVKTATQALSLLDRNERFVRWFGGMSPSERAQLVHFRPKSGSGGSLTPFETQSGNSALRRLLYYDQTSWLPDNLLERGDRMTMAASLEARMPFLDRDLVAFVSSLPDSYRVRGLTTKWLLRAAMRHAVPSEVLRRPKVGFRVPVNEWFRGSMSAYLRENLLGASSRTRVFYDVDQLTKLVDEHVNGRQNNEKVLWSLLNLELWAQAYAISG